MEEEAKKKEQLRLEEIVNMCAEYEKQAQWEKNNKPQQNRIKTNGSLPRDKRPSQQTPSPTTKEQMFYFENHESPSSQNENSRTWNGMNKSNQYEYVSINQQQKFQQIIITSTPNQDHQNSRIHYENVDISNLENVNATSTAYENVNITSNSVNGQTETAKVYPQSPRTRIKTNYIHSSQKERYTHNFFLMLQPMTIRET